MPAAELEKAAADVIARHLVGRADSHRICTNPDLLLGDAIRKTVRGLAPRLADGHPDRLGRRLSGGHIRKDRIELSLDGSALAEALRITPEELNPSALTAQAPFALRRRGVEGKIVVGERLPRRGPVLLRALSRAHLWTADLRKSKSLGEIAAETGYSGAYIRTRAQLSFLSPAIQGAILEGRQLSELTLERIIRKPVPLDWDIRAKLYGVHQGADHP